VRGFDDPLVKRDENDLHGLWRAGITVFCSSSRFSTNRVISRLIAIISRTGFQIERIPRSSPKVIPESLCSFSGALYPGWHIPREKVIASGKRDLDLGRYTNCRQALFTISEFLRDADNIGRVSSRVSERFVMARPLLDAGVRRPRRKSVEAARRFRESTQRSSDQSPIRGEVVTDRSWSLQIGANAMARSYESSL
jgi:hypothetical protein